MTVDELLQRISSRELAEWKAYWQIEPFGEQRADVRSGQIAAVIANIWRDHKKHPKPYEISDFMPKFEGTAAAQRRQTWQEQLQIVEVLNRRFGGRDERRR